MSNPPGGLSSYRKLFKTPGTKGFSSAGFLARMDASMLGIGIVLLVQHETGSYAIASTVSATAALVQASSAPFLARLIDRRGQAQVAIPAVLISGSGLGGLLLSIHTDAPFGRSTSARSSPAWPCRTSARWSARAGPSCTRAARSCTRPTPSSP